MPRTRAPASSRGPPELPGLIEASVWIAPLDLELGQRFDRAVGCRDDADRERLLLAEGAADRRHRLADHELAVIAQLQRVQLEAVRLDLEQGDVGEGVEADDLGRHHVAVGELDVDLLGGLAGAAGVVGDDVGVGDDAAAGVEDEARALGGAPSVAEDRPDRDHSGRGLAVDPRRVEAVLRRLHDHPRRLLRAWRRRLRGGAPAAARAAAAGQRQRRCRRRAQRPRSHAAAFGDSAAGGVAVSDRERGRSSVKAVKRLLEAIATRPCMRCASSRAIASPRPEPPAESAV